MIIGVGDTVWLKGWGAGPFLVAGLTQFGRLRLTLPDGSDPWHRYRHYGAGTGGEWVVEREVLTAEPPPAPPPRQPFLTGAQLVQLVAGLATIACATAAIVVAST